MVGLLYMVILQGTFLVTQWLVHFASAIQDCWLSCSCYLCLYFLNYCLQTYTHALSVILSVILWSYCPCFLLILPWCFGVWLSVCDNCMGSCNFGCCGHLLGTSHGSSSRSHCPVACLVFVLIHLLIHVLAVTTVSVLVHVHLESLLIIFLIF
jgi:hypothetical protein